VVLHQLCGAKGYLPARKPLARNASFQAGVQVESGYTKRARAEAAIGRFKQVIGDGLRSRTDGRQATEVAIAAEALNRMLELGRPAYVRIA
jgi:outer membrane protein assembly factor BamD (BamD/ComL family)